MKKRKLADGGKTDEVLPTSSSIYRKNAEYADDSDARAKKLRADVENTSSESSRISQTLPYLAGQKAGEAADNSIRKLENIKESMAEDAEEGSRRLRATNTAIAEKNYKDDLRSSRAAKPVKKYAKGGSIDGAAQRGKTRGKVC